MKFWDEEYGLTEREGKPVVSSLHVAELFKKRHDNILRDISKKLKPDSGLSREFCLKNFREISYRDSYGRKQKAYAMTRDGFMILVMGYNGVKARKFKEAYINQFNHLAGGVENV
ncbi:MAG TPA: hypothetical protein DD727_02125 [Clostridiales bacterium]|nr:hypothetical protein [Clostridiales bacterium]